MLHAAHQKCSIPHQKASKHPKWSYCLSLTHAISTSDTNGSSAAGDFPKTWQQLKPTLNNIEFFGHMHAAQSFRYSLKHKSFFSPALTAAKPGQTGVTAVKFLQFCMAARFSLGGGRRRAVKKDLTWTNKLHKLNNEEFGRWSPILDSESIRPYARHWEDTGKGGIIPSGRDMCTPSGIRRRLGSGHKPPLSATTWRSRYSSPAQRTGSSEVCGTPSMTSAIIAALPIPSQEIPISVFTSQRAAVYNPHQLLSNYRVLLFQDWYRYGSLPIHNPDFLNCLYLSC